MASADERGMAMGYFLRHHHNNLWTGHFSLFPEELCVHAISTRLGGVSTSPYDSLNLALHVEDDVKAVLENRYIFFQTLGLSAERLVTPNQVHGDVIAVVSEEDAGRGSRNYADSISRTDALITNTPGLPLLLCFADCVPVLFLDPVHHAAGIAHGGWKGTVKKIAAKTLARMGEVFHTDPAQCLIGIGPSIGPCCFTIKNDVAEQFYHAFPEDADHLVEKRGGELHADLWKANRLQLLRAGAKEENIQSADVCTCCKHAWYFSYRGDGGQTGRIAAMIALK